MRKADVYYLLIMLVATLCLARNATQDHVEERMDNFMKKRGPAMVERAMLKISVQDEILGQAEAQRKLEENVQEKMKSRAVSDKGSAPKKRYH